MHKGSKAVAITGLGGGFSPIQLAQGHFCEIRGAFCRLKSNRKVDIVIM